MGNDFCSARDAEEDFPRGKVKRSFQTPNSSYS